jgi:hypothetical protein
MATRRTRLRKSTRRRRRVQKAGERIDVNRILITKNIIDAVKRINPDFSTKGKGFKLDPEPTFGSLQRIDEYVGRPRDMTNEQPIVVTPVGSFYRITDGRHRFAQVLALGLPNVNVRIE